MWGPRMGTPGVGIGIVGMGTCLPDQVRGNDHWSPSWRATHGARLARDIGGSVDLAVQARHGVDPEIVEHAARYHDDVFRGTEARRVMAPDQEVSDLEVTACREAIADAGVDLAAVDTLIGYSMPPDLVGVGNHGPVAAKLGIGDDLMFYSLDAGCASFLPILRTATLEIASGQRDLALVFCGSGMSRLLDYEAPSSVLIGDGAVAAVIGRVDRGLGFVAQAMVARPELYRALHAAPPAGRWYGGAGPLRVINEDLGATLRLGGTAASLCEAVCSKLFAATGYGPGDVDFFAVAQSTAWYGRAMADRLGIPPDRLLPVADHFRRYGHLFHASLPLNLYLARSQGRLAPGDLVLMFTPGTGAHVYATLYRWHTA